MSDSCAEVGDGVPIRVGVSSCLLGEQVRYDGGHKRDDFISGVLARCFQFVPVCPEVAIGLGMPRPPIQLVGDPRRPRARGVREPSIDVTERLEAFAREQAGRLHGLSGYIFKSRSPSCGMVRVKVYDAGGMVGAHASGIFARVLMEQRPLLPVEEEGRLNDPVQRESFVNRVYALWRWQRMLANGLSPAGLIGFHSDHKYMVMAHSQAAYQRLGRLLSDLKGQDLTVVANAYLSELMTTLKRRVGPQRHINVLQHILGYLKRSLSADEKAEMTEALEAYRRGEVPLIVPITLIRHHFRRMPDPYISRQRYLNPYPDNLGLRNHV
jgi:uncharacterized protein YbgA (DUF1722 family)/uncharacterized protein YbbK (DUF523 family)